MQDRPRPRIREDTGRSPRFPPSVPVQAVLAHRNETTSGAGTDDETNDEPEYDIEGVYVISVAARILEMHPQTLRKYERLGLVNPVRTVGMLRLYSPVDIQKILLIRHLMVNLELNLAGVKFALALVDNLMGLRELVKIRIDDGKTRAMLEQEISRLLQNLNLPLQLPLNLRLNLPLNQSMEE
ncbi:MAG TPA: MerR family transcriptional regulator [Dehalococcoidia bacterium]|nr:MerR family transcriptional regulator [Dehalococcoidia bacterium]